MLAKLSKDTHYYHIKAKNNAILLNEEGLSWYFSNEESCQIIDYFKENTNPLYINLQAKIVFAFKLPANLIQEHIAPSEVPF